MLEIKITEKKDFTFVEFALKENITPEDLPQIIQEFEKKLTSVKRSKGIIISGRGPIWLYATLVHYLHPFLWIATYDPRLDGGVVVATHTQRINL